MQRALQARRQTVIRGVSDAEDIDTVCPQGNTEIFIIAGKGRGNEDKIGHIIPFTTQKQSFSI